MRFKGSGTVYDYIDELYQCNSMLEIPVLSNHFLTTSATELFLIFGLNRFWVTMTPMKSEKYSQNLKFGF